MNTKPNRFMKEEVYRIVGAALEVLNKLGHGFNEKPYEKALVVEFDLRGIPYVQQAQFQVVYKTHVVGVFMPDLIAFKGSVVDTKVIECTTDIERAKFLTI